MLKNGEIIYDNNGYSQLKPLCSTNCRLDVANATSADFTNVQIANSSTNNAQKWFITNMGSGKNKISTALDLNQCLEVVYSSTNDGANVQIYHSNDTDTQRWVLIPAF